MGPPEILAKSDLALRGQPMFTVSSSLQNARRRLGEELDRDGAVDTLTNDTTTEPNVSPIADAATGIAASAVGNGAAQAMMVPLASKMYGVTGAGIKIGILSDSFNLKGGYASGVANGSLNAGVKILKEGPTGGADEGRAMAELIHKIAPNAQIEFYSGFNGSADFAAGIRALAADGCNMIVDDITYLTEPFFQTGDAIQTAVQSVIDSGVSYFTSAGNAGMNFYQAGFTGVKAALPGLAGNYQVENFGIATAPVLRQSLSIARGATATIDLQWDQPFAGIGGKAGAANSLGMVLYGDNNRIVGYATMNDVGRNPNQILQFTNTSASNNFSLAIFTNGGSTVPGQFKYIAYGAGVAINDAKAGKGSGTLIGHEQVAAANVVGAANYTQTAAYGGKNQVEGFSSGGPGQLLFDANGNRLAISAGTGGVDFVAPDGVATNVFSPFFGTSAAAPNAAAVAALMLQANRNLTPAQVSADLIASTISATGPVGTTGAGLIQAQTAVKMALLTPASTASRAEAGAATGGNMIGGVTVSHASEGAITLDDALATVACDATAAEDFYTSIDPAVAGLMAPPSANLAAGNQLVLLNNGSVTVPYAVPALQPFA